MLAFFAIIIIFNTPVNLKAEHSIMRDCLSLWLGFTVVLLQCKALIDDLTRFKYIFLSSIALIMLSLLRQETIIIFILVMAANVGLFFRSWDFKKLVAISLPALCVFVVFAVGKSFQDKEKVFQVEPYGGAKFNISYYHLQPQNFNYKSERYPELVDAFYDIFTTDNNQREVNSSLKEWLVFTKRRHNI